MASRKPLVLINGRPSQLPAGDTLQAPVTAGAEIAMTNENVSAISFGQPVYVSDADAVDLAQANAIGTAEILGLVSAASIPPASVGAVQTNGIIIGTTAQWDAVTGQTGGLTTGAVYYLSDVDPGKLTVTPPSTVGSYVTRVGLAVCPTDMNILTEAAIGL